MDFNELAPPPPPQGELRFIKSPLWGIQGEQIHEQAHDPYPNLTLIQQFHNSQTPSHLPDHLPPAVVDDLDVDGAAIVEVTGLNEAAGAEVLVE